MIITGQVNNNDPLFYLNQKPPGLTPEIFAPGIISTDKEYEFGEVKEIEVEAADKFNIIYNYTW